jgi:hypothetical protein
MNDSRTPRDDESREDSVRPSDSWVPASILPIPEPEDGYVFRWIRTSALGHADNANVSKKFREGWKPVRAQDHKSLQVTSDIGSQFKGNIEVGGLLLCKAPKETMDKRNVHYKEVAQRQMESVEQSYMKENDPRMAKFKESESRTSIKP